MQNETIMLTQINAATNTAKAYKVVLEERPDGWALIAFNGKIGGSLKEQPKLAGADYAAAKKEYDKLVKSKIGGGYKPDGAADVEIAATIGAEGRQMHEDLVPMRPTEFDVGDLASLDPDEWMAQEKHDGENRPLRLSEVIDATNRTGQVVPVRAELKRQLDALRAVVGDLVVDSEDMGDGGVVIFDIRSGMGVTTDAVFARRNEALSRLSDIVETTGPNGLNLIRVDVAMPLREVLAMDGIEAARRQGAEGVVLKRADAVYAPGKTPNAKKAATLKLKFTEDATFRVSASRNPAKRSVGIESWSPETGEWSGRGNVTVPEKAPMPAVGDLIDVNYLYIVGPFGAPVQPVFKRPRPDATEADCDAGRLKLKRGTEAVTEPDADAPSI